MRIASFPKRSNLCADHFALLLKKCLKIKASRTGKQTHALILTSGIINLNVLSLHSQLVGLYASCGDLRSASHVFKRIKKPNTFALNWMVLGCVFNGRYAEAIGYVPLMQSSVKHLNEFTFSVLVKVCVGLGDLKKGREVHCLASVSGLENKVPVANALLDMYCKCGDLVFAGKMFDGMAERNVASWTSMICGHCNAGNFQKGISLLERMKCERIQPNEFTWNALIASCARSGESFKAFELLNMMRREGLVPDLVTWNSMISGFVQSQKLSMALWIFSDMLASGTRPNEVTVTGLLPGCGFIGSTHRGREIHGVIYRMGLDVDPFVATALIDMYSKCASINHARIVFDNALVKNIATWNAMIGCYGKHGPVMAVMELFKKMKDEVGISPNQVTFTSVLSACSHGGEVERGIEIFRSMREVFKVKPNREHYACLVDMLCRAGKVEEAYEFMKEMSPMGINNSMVGAFFNGCKIHRRRELVEMMGKEILGMKLNRAGLVTLSNIYAAEGEWHEVLNVRKTIREKADSKKLGFSWLEGG